MRVAAREVSRMAGRPHGKKVLRGGARDGGRRQHSSGSQGERPGRKVGSKPDNSDSNTNMAYLLAGVSLLGLGLSYASVPLYQAFCQATGYGGTVQIGRQDKLEGLADSKTGKRSIKILFDAGTSLGMPWKFVPLQREIELVTGETALAFYNAENSGDKATTGVATYNVTPMKAGLYFNKVQCFCFHEQRLQAKENVDMPVFFFIDNDFEDDPRMDDVDDITLSYTFFPVDEDEVEPNDDEDGQEDGGKAA